MHFKLFKINQIKNYDDGTKTTEIRFMLTLSIHSSSANYENIFADIHFFIAAFE